MPSLLEQAAKNVGDVVRDAIQLKPAENVLVVYDRDCPLAALLTDAYQAALPQARMLEFSSVPPEQVIATMYACKPGDLVVLVQSTNFRLNEFRIRIELFKRGLKNIEHTHLNRIAPEEEEVYVESLAYDRTYYRRLGHALKERMDRSTSALVRCAGTELRYDTGLESTKLNVGDYEGMKNVGGTFPIGEVFSEPKDFARVNGDVMIFGFAGEDHLVRIVAPFKVRVEAGVLVDWSEGPKEFAEIMEIVKAHEAIHVREFGLGLNRAMSKTRTVRDITAYERMNGMHLSLGAKHTIYAKEGFNRKESRYHIDVFVDAREIQIDGETVFKDGAYVV